MSPEHFSFSLPWTIPFIGILMSLAFMPLVAPTFWHRRYGAILMAWISGFLATLGWVHGLTPSAHALLYTLFHHYIPFMAMITVLFTIGGGIHITMKGKASPFMNTGLLGVGALLANFIGTTGASMLLIRPVIALNRYRRYKTHLIIFFIFLVSNIGGVLTPLGDPPLFIGFLNGIDFFWTTTHLIYPFLMVGGALLVLFWLVDHYYFYHDPSIPDPDHLHGEAKIQLKGRRNFFFLVASIAAILMESLWLPKPHITLWGLEIDGAALARDLFLFSMAYASWKSTPSKIHETNQFTWGPLEEVALVFLGIFITVIPVLSLLKAGEANPLNTLVQYLNPNGIPDSRLYFWVTGLLSSILDNAPTYLIFFNIAGGDPHFLMTEGAQILTALSTGAVFMGAMTYIGNAPNFMVRSIATRAHIKMPGFLGYLLWSFAILLPLFLGFSWLWFF